MDDNAMAAANTFCSFARRCLTPTQENIVSLCFVGLLSKVRDVENGRGQ